MTGHLVNMTELVCNIVETKMDKYVQSVFFDYLLRDYTPELTDQKTIRNTINALLKNKILIDLINTEYGLDDNPITTKTFSKKNKEESSNKIEVKAVPVTETKVDSQNQESLHNTISSIDTSTMVGGTPIETPPDEQHLQVRIQIMHWYMFFNYYFLKVAIEVSFIKYINPHSFFSKFFYSGELSHHPVLEDKYLNDTINEYNEMFDKIKPILTIGELKDDMNENIMQTIFRTEIFDIFAREAGHGRISGGSKSSKSQSKHVPIKKSPTSNKYKRIPRSVKYRRSTRHRKKHRHVTSKSRPQYTSKKRKIKHIYSKKNHTSI